MHKQKILVTGGAGYVGSVLAQTLLEHGYAVRVIDSLKWGGDSLVGLAGHPDFEFLRGDVRSKDDVERSVKGVHGVVHLAAIVGDPACKKEPDLARATNFDGSVLLYDASVRAGVKRFVFASTCSNYGKMADAGSLVTEDSELKPVSLYAELKVAFERHVMQARDSMITTALRFATAFGLSNRMRFDLTVSEFTRDALLNKELVIFGEQFWRPYCHTRDLAGACRLILEADAQAVNRQAFNVGDETQNFQKQMLVDEIQKVIDGVSVRYVPQVDDPRDYRVAFDKIKKLGYRISRTVPDGVREVAGAIESGLIADPRSKRYSNI